MRRVKEFNFDGIVGPTHNFAGLSFGNVASSSNKDQVSSPKAAALQGLEKMKFVASLGVGQAVLPPLHRPNLAFLRTLGFQGSDHEIIEDAYEVNPVYVACAYSASNMWTANAATISPSLDTRDEKLHITPANLSSTLHRSIEPWVTRDVLRAVFQGPEFEVHDPLPGCDALADEGAANHTRLCSTHDKPGLELFVFGREALNKAATAPNQFPARQTREASEAIVRGHLLERGRYFVLQQTPEAIDAGVFHNDVISVGNENVLLVHERAFVDQRNQFDSLRRQFEDHCDDELIIIEFSEDEVPLSEAVSSYLFNSQLVTRPDGRMTLVCPRDVKDNDTTYAASQRLVDEENPVDAVEYLDLRQSMNNGGGPACLRLRVAMTESERQAVHPGVLWSDSLCESLTAWVEGHYRDQLRPEDLRDPRLLEETRAATDDLLEILGLPPGLTVAD